MTPSLLPFRLNKRGEERLDGMIRELATGKPDCEACVNQWGWGRWREENCPGTYDPMPVQKATCIAWQPDPRVMVDLSHLQFSCDFHLDFNPYPTRVDYGEGPRPNEAGSIHVVREVVWRGA